MRDIDIDIEGDNVPRVYTSSSASLHASQTPRQLASPASLTVRLIESLFLFLRHESVIFGAEYPDIMHIMPSTQKLSKQENLTAPECFATQGRSTAQYS
jgi:hypothetical protein